jgi:hypothetical protein
MAGATTTQAIVAQSYAPALVCVQRANLRIEKGLMQGFYQSAYCIFLSSMKE